MDERTRGGLRDARDAIGAARERLSRLRDEVARLRQAIADVRSDGGRRGDEPAPAEAPTPGAAE